MLKWKHHRQIQVSPQSTNITPKSVSHPAKSKSKMPSRVSFGPRDLHRKSLDNLNTKRTVSDNKENLGIYFIRSPLGNNSFSALKDLSNGKSPNRTPQSRQTLSDSPLRKNTINQRGYTTATLTTTTTLPTFDAEYSPMLPEFNKSTPINRKSYRNRHSLPGEESLSSSRIGDATLDKMLDAIIESAKKDMTPKFRQRCPSMECLEEDFEPSIHEMEVKTPPHLKRQRVVRRKKPQSQTSLKKQQNQPMIGLTLPNGIPSPETPKTAYTQNSKSMDDLANMETPQDIAFIIDSLPQDLMCSTPTAPTNINPIKRCLSFSPGSDDDFVDPKRISVASSNASSGTFSRCGPVKGSLDLAIFAENGKLNVHVIRCRELQRSNGSTTVNAYVKVALIPADTIDTGFQRTAVYRNSSRPYFDHRFKFDICDENSYTKRLQLAVWHRDRDLKRSEFLGCMSIPIANIINSPINGSYKLQSQSCLNNPQPFVSVIATATATATTTISTATTTSNQNLSTEQSSTTVPSVLSSLAQQIKRHEMTSTVRQSSIEEDGISIDSVSVAVPVSQNPNDAHHTGEPITLSKKAIHQRDADENLFLRFLELDPPVDAQPPPPPPGASALTTAPASAIIGAIAAQGMPARRLSASKLSLGRTPFTITKRLTRTPDKGFGFSVVWTHPPRVEKVEPGLSADKNGIHTGDYVIFVDKHNVVTMPEADVLNLIRSQGNTLLLEIFRRSGSSVAPALSVARSSQTMLNGGAKSRVASVASNYTSDEIKVSSNVGGPTTSNSMPAAAGLPRPSTACSTTSIETTKRRLNLPQVTFSKESIAPLTDNRRKILNQLVSREQNFVAAQHFGMNRFVQPLQERKDLISPNDHRTLFQNIDELIRISEDILDQLVNDDQEPHLNFTSRVYLSKSTAICAAYKKYCNGIKRADCVLVNKSRQSGSDFIAFITEPQVPRKRPDLTQLIHRPLQHFREILKLMQLLASHCHVDSEEHKNFTTVINELQAAYREITVSAGFMEPHGEGRPLLTLQDLEARLVFTRCKPFTLAVQGRQWVFGGDLSRVEGRSVKPYWTLLFSDIILFAKVSRDRVLFITEEPIPLVNVIDSCFNIRKKGTEFRLTIDPNGRMAESPTGYCAPDLTRTPKKGARRKCLILRAPSMELKAVWQNLLQRQIFLVNAALGQTPLSSPLDSPDVLNTLLPLSDLGLAAASMKLSLIDSINQKNLQQNRSKKNEANQIEELIDEKCRILNKTGTAKGSALHLANWMKGQLDKQQEQARLAAAMSRESLDKFEDNLLSSEDDNEERITFWTRAQLEKRTHELNLAKENGTMQPLHSHFSGKRLSGVEELGMSDAEDIISASRSTTSDSQITVRSSPVANATDTLSVCRSCHKTCKKKSSGTNSPTLVSNSLKVQHSQASPNRCCQLNGSIARSSISSASSTVTGDQSQSELSSQTNASNNNTLSNEQENEKLLSDNSSKSVPTTIPISIASAVASATIASLLNGNYSGSDNKKTDNERKKPTPNSLLRKTENAGTINAAGGRQSLRKLAKDNFVPCNCKCNPEDFFNTTLSPDEIHQETCKILPNIIEKKSSPIKLNDYDPHKNCKCVCKNKNQKYDNEQLDDDLSLVLIGLAQLNPAAQLLNADSFVPTISVVPPTPDAILSKTSTNIWDNHSMISSGTAKKTTSQIPGQAIIENIPEDSADESFDEEPPYRPMNVTLKRFGTLSSLEHLPSEEIIEDGSEDGDDDIDGEHERNKIKNDNGEDDDDIEVVTRQVYNEKNDINIHDEQANWTSRAGSFVAGKMSFFEESRAFIDKYLGRWNQEEQARLNDEEQLDECTSGANSGEEIWGTPTSGGENDEMHMMNSDCTQSSPTKSSTSPIDDDDDTELMMDELLMAPPMTASSIRGLLPRRTLEPLFEEETESDEEKTHQDSEEFKKGETASNGHDLEDSTGSSNDDTEEEPDNLIQYQRQQIIQPMVKCSPSMPNVVTTSQALYGSSAMMTKTITTTKLVPIMATNSSNSSIINNVNVSTSFTVNSTKMQPQAESQIELGKTVITSTIRKAKFSPPPPPPRRLLLTQTKQRSVQQQTNGTPQQPSEINQKSGDIADTGSLVAVVKEATIKCQQAKQKVVSTMKSSAGNIVPIEKRQSITAKPSSMPQQQIKTSQTSIISITDSVVTMGTSTMTPTKQTPTTSATSIPNQKESTSAQPGSGLSPRLEMRLALNNDIMGDEDLICYDPGPNLTTILGHDLSTFHRLTGRDLLTRSATNRVQPRETVISFSQQRNSKMDTPTVNRKRPNQNQDPHHQQPQHLHPDRNTWSNSVFADQIENNVGNVDRSKNNNSISDESCLSDLEVLAKREKIFCMSQLRSGSPARSLMTATSISSMALTEIDTVIPKRTRKIGRDETALMAAGKGNRLVNFLTRRNSENQLAKNCSQHSLTESSCSSATDRRPVSPKKDNDKPSLNRRFWKQITKRRRANSISEIEAS